MADNINDDTLDNPIIPQSENLSDKIISLNDTEIITPIPETENMEVHHHPDLHHKPKKWKEYFLEFLMIFLAVTMGFFAENIRETQLEKKELNSYVTQILENLKADTSRSNHALLYNQSKSLYLDSLRYEIASAISDKINSNKMYYFSIKRTGVSFVLFKQGAITQLKNSGKMRLIENKNLTNEILEYYDRWVIAVTYSETECAQKQTEFDKNSSNFFDSEYFEWLTKRETALPYAPDTALQNYIAAILDRQPPLTLLNYTPLELKKT